MQIVDRHLLCDESHAIPDMDLFGPYHDDMPLPRRSLVSDEHPGAYHVMSRCVRRAFLCGDQTEHRRAWVRDLIHQAAGAFAVEVLAYAVMSTEDSQSR